MCHELKPEIDFAFRSIKTRKRQSHCRKCHAAYRREHYRKNRRAYITREAARIKSNRIANRPKLREYLLAHPCVDCGEADIVLLEFDHIDPTQKRREVSILAARKPWHLVMKEIEKCVVRCVACHRKRTARQFNWRSASPLPPPEQTIPIVIALAAGERACSKCGRLLPLSEFGVKNKKTGRRNRKCRSCVATASREHYQRNRESYLERNRKRRRSASPKRSFRLDYLLTHPCVDCGETDPVLLDFDHRDGELKVDDVARLIWDRRWEEAAEEIAKCDVRCVRCHRRKTAKQFGWSRIGEAHIMYTVAGVL